MANKDNTDIDYQYPDEQFDTDAGFDVQQEDAVTQKKSGPFSRFSKKKLIIGAAVLMVLFSVYQVLNQKDKQAANVTQPEIEQEKTEKVVQSPPKATAVQPKKSVQIAQPKVNLVPTRSAGISEEQFNQIETQFQSMNQEIAGMKEAMATMINAVGVLATQVQELRSAQQISPSTFMPFKPKVAYHLTAVIPGRAWLESNKGNLITVKEGDSLPEYGMINKIDPNEGWVETSSGLVITYGKNDS